MGVAVVEEGPRQEAGHVLQEHPWDAALLQQPKHMANSAGAAPLDALCRRPAPIRSHQRTMGNNGCQSAAMGCNRQQ